MNHQVKRVYEQARRLAQEEQAEHAEFAVASADEAKIEAARRAEIEDRHASLENGTAILRPASDVLAELRSR